jgi:hypothetical protein
MEYRLRVYVATGWIPQLVFQKESFTYLLTDL